MEAKFDFRGKNDYKVDGNKLLCVFFLCLLLLTSESGNIYFYNCHYQ